jgi:hypothetical protein
MSRDSDDAVPQVDSAENETSHDVIGNKSDTVAGDSLYALLLQLLAEHEILSDHIHSAPNAYPRGAGAVLVAKSAGEWAAVPDTKTEIIPANTITSPFDSHWISVNSITANGEYELYLYSGAAGEEVEIGMVPITRTAVQAQEGSVFNMSEIQAPNTRISAALRGSPAGAESLNIKIGYHTY